ncbi:Ig-like domain-containing protein [Enterobacter ludwigii]|uniref:Ig-like domain-containing protein n=2 Tax=Enterobacter ludwigii TaxID=299767 RepID=UPI0032091E7A
MDNSKINLLVIDGDNIVRIAELPAQAEGAPVRVKSLKNGKFLLVRGTNEPAPDHIVVKRDGDDLMIFTQEGDDKADIIIEDFYLQQGELYGMAQEGSYHLYESSDSDNEAFLLLEEGGSDTLHLSEGERLALPEVTSSELSHGMMAAGAVAAVGLLTGIVAALNAGSSGKTAPAVPSEIQATDHVGIIIGAMASGVSTDDARPVLDGNGTPGSLIQVYDNGSLVGSTMVNPEGKWRWQPENALPEGEHDFQFAALARGRQSAKSPALNFTVDLTPPDKPVNISITDGNDKDLSSGGVTNANPLHLSGKGDPGDTVLLYDGDTLVGTTVVDAGGHWHADIILPSEGDHDLRAGFRDPAGNAGAKSDPVTIDYDVTPPDAPGAIEIADGNDKDLSFGGVTNANPLHLSGKGDLGDTVLLYDGDILVGTTVVDAGGHWRADITLPSEGDHDLRAGFRDPAGNAGAKSDPVTVDYDVTPPDAPAAIEIADGNDKDLSSGGVTNANPLHLSGKGDPEDTVLLYDGDTLVGTTVVDAGGHWHADIILPSEGDHDLRAGFRDPAGNAGAKSDPVTIDYDVTPPDAPGAIEIADGNDKDLSFGGVTNANPLHLSGKGDLGDTVLLYDGDILVGTTVVDAGGHWRADITLPSEGDHDLRAGFRDPAGNAGAKSDPVTVDYDVTPPDAPAAIEIADGNDKDLSSGGVTNANPLHLSGKGDPEDTVLLYDGDTLVGTTVVDAGGHWRADITLPSEGDHDLRVGFRDPAGNAGAKSEPVTVNYDITSPDAPVPEVLENSVGKDLILQGLSNDGHVNMAGKNGDAGDIVKLYDGNTLIGSSTVRADGSWSVAGELIGGDGNHNLKASFTDPAGNESEKSTPLTVDLDTVAEAPLFTLTDNTPTLTGSAGSVEPGALVTIYNGTTPVASFSANADGSWTWRPTPTLSDGNYQFSAKQTDRAGNISAASEWLGFRVATTVDDFNDTTGQGWTFASAWDGVGFFDGQQVQLSGGRNAGHSTAGDIMSRTMHVEAGHTYNVSVRSLVWATTGIIIDNPSHFLTITVDGVKVLDNVQVINGVYGGSWTASTTGNVVITLSDSTDTNGVGSWIVLDNFTVRDQGVTASNLFSDNALTNEPFSLVEHVLALTDNIASLDLSRAADLYQTTAQEVHAISLKGHGQNLLNIGIDDLLALGHENQFLNNGNKQLMVKGDEGDRVTLDTIAGEHGIAHWNAQADVMVEGEVYHVYQNGNHDVEVLIQQGIQIQIQ